MSAELQQQAAPAAAEGVSLLDSIIEQSRIATNESEKSHTRDLIGELVDQVLQGSVTVSRDLSASIDARIAEIDKLISDQLNNVMHHAEFQKLEASWRGLNYLVMQSETSTQLKIKVLNASKKDLVKDFKLPPSLTRARCSRKSTRKSTAPSAARLTPRWWATTNSPATRKTSTCWTSCPTWPPPPTRR